MSDFIGDRECTTHHNACDCRELRFGRLKTNSEAMRNLLKEYGAWEADLILDDGDMLIDVMSTKNYDRMIELQAMRNEILKEQP